jgi:DNA-binding ferritin-like protein
MEYDHTKDVVQFALLETLAFLRAIHWSHWTAHWQVNYYGDHLLFEELYNNTQKEIDSLGEKCVSFFGTSSVNDKDQAKKMIEILSWIEEEDYLKRAVAFEDKFIGYLVATWELVNGANKMTMGLDSLLQSISETHEKHLYLLRQRTKTNKVGSTMNDRIAKRVADRFLKVAKSPRKKWENPNNGRSKVVFTEAILDNPKKLLSWWENNVGELLSDTSKTAHHMTIEYGGNNPGIPLERVEQLGVGSPVRLEIIGYAQNDRVQAVLVKPQGVSSTNRYPHITVAVGNGGNPSESNDLLARGYERVKGETLTAKIGYFGRGKHLTQIDWENE